MSLHGTRKRVMHDLRPFLGRSHSPAASRRDLARTHLRLHHLGASAATDVTSVKEVDVLGRTMAYFDSSHLHHLFDEIFLGGVYAFDHPDDSPRILDAGANIGMAMLWFRLTYPNARITSIEPDQATFDVLRRNIERNGFARVDAVRGALAAAPGEATLHIDPARPARGRQSVDPLRIGGTPIVVPAITLSSLVDGPIDLLKIDIEGAEHDVMAEMESSGALAEVNAITMEYHHHIDPTIDRLSEMLALLERNGFAYRIGGRVGSAPLDAVSVTQFQDIAIRAIRKPTG